MAGKSTYFANKTLDTLWGGPAFVRPATVYLALFLTAPTDAGGGVEVSGMNYSRVGLTNDATIFPAAAGGIKTVPNQINFPSATGPWGSVRAVGLYDAPAGGNLLVWTNLSATRFIDTMDVARFLTNTINFTED